MSKPTHRGKPSNIQSMRLSLQPGNTQTLRVSLDPKNGNRLILKQKDLDLSFRHSISVNSQGYIPVYIQKETEKQAKISGLMNTLSLLEDKIDKIKTTMQGNKKTRKYLLPRESECSLKDLDFLEGEFEEKPKLKIHYIKQQDQNSTEYTYKKLQTIENQNVREKRSPSVIINFRKKNKTYYIQQAVKPTQMRNNLLNQHMTMTLKVLQSCSKLRSCSFSQIDQKKITLKKHQLDQNKKTLLLDLDETLIHCQQEPIEGKKHDIQIPIRLENGEFAKAYIYLRPYVISFLKKISKLFEIIVFTASHASYADPVLNQLDPFNEFFRYRLYRQHCVQIYPNVFAKDLRILNRPIKDMVLVDNAPYSYIFQLQNGIPILPYYHGQDLELSSLEKYLQVLSKAKDVREINKETFKLHRYSQFRNINDIINNLYIY